MEKDFSYIKKQLAAYARGGDFSHPGEIEAIDIVMQHVSSLKFNSLLDVGCGLGGTAKHLKDQGYTPIGIDISKNNIAYATNRYPEVQFHCCNVLDSFKLLNPQKFDLICLFSSFLLFEHQQDSLATLSNLAHKDSKLILFDYTLLPNNADFSFISNKYKPIEPDNINSMLLNSGWELEQFIDMRDNFLRWYTEFSNNIEIKKNDLISMFGNEAYNNFFTTYNSYMELYKINVLGGCTIIAKKL